MTPARRWFIAIAIAFIATFAVMRGYNIDRTRPSERYVYHVIPVALSVLYYHWPYDYTGNRSVEAGFVAQRDNLPKALDDIVQHPEKYQETRAYFWNADDRGALDFTVAAFYLFGPTIKSMAYFYMVVLAASIVVFCLAHYRSLAALKTLAFATVSLAVCFGIWNYINHQGGAIGFDEGFINLSESRLLGLLAFFPALSLFFSTIQDKPMSRWQLLAAVFQSLLLVEIVRARMSVLWLVPPLLLVAAASIFWRSGVPSRRNAVRVLTLVILSLFIKSGYEHAVYNQEYFAEKGSRTIWHNVVMGLSANPFFIEKLGVKTADPVSARIVLRYDKSGIVTLSDQHLSAEALHQVDEETDAAMNAFGDYGTYDWPAHERKARRFVFAVFRTYPWEFLKTFFWYKPVECVEETGDMFLPRSNSKGGPNTSLPLIYPTALAALLAFLAGYFSFGGAPEGPASFRLFLTLCVLFSLSISIVFYPAPTQLGDPMLVLLVWGLSLTYRAGFELRRIWSLSGQPA